MAAAIWLDNRHWEYIQSARHNFLLQLKTVLRHIPLAVIRSHGEQSGDDEYEK
ncbi:DUF6890 family protein [Citrobacter freundii]|uniref:DUF6890 family protein n=1 Tax=Citrobacter freundii TaxID=546 RepID=UPI00397C6A15